MATSDLEVRGAQADVTDFHHIGPGTLAVQPDGQNGLTVPSVALVFQLISVDQRYCLQRLGVLDAVTLDQIFAELDKLTGR